MAVHAEDHVLSEIEKQLSQSPHQSLPTITITTENHTINVNKADTEAESTLNSTSNTATPVVATAANSSTFGALISGILTFVAIFPLLLPYVIVNLCFTGSIQSLADHRAKGIFRKMQDFETTEEKIQRLNLVAATRFGCLALLWLMVNLCVPSLTGVALFGYPLWKCSSLVVVIFLGYPSAELASILLTTIFIGEYSYGRAKQPKVEYFIKGLQNNFTSLFHFVLILLMWLLYFRTKHGLNPSTRFEKLATWTLVSLLVGAFLWVIKSAAILEWKAKAVYKRFKGRIITAGFQLYFLQIVTSQSCFPELLPWRDHHKTSKSISYRTTMETKDNNKVTMDRKIRRIQNSVFLEKVTIDELDCVAGMVTRLAQVIQREDDGIPQIVAEYEEKISNIFGSTGLKKKDLEVFFSLREAEVYLLLEELRADQSSEEITCDAFQKWMVDAHKNCLSVGYTLIDAFAVVNVLNRVIIGFLLVMIILIWLFVTELATTNVLVLIASPILTLSFMFGETCKTFFQGIIFSFVTHPYDVGDQCIIDGMELEVKSIGVLTTTFLRIGSKEKMMYPHASLATKLITNLEGEADPSDMIELILDSSTTKSKILGLEKDLESFFESNDRHGSYEKVVHVTVKEIRSNIKVIISFTHVMNVQDVSHSQCLQKKNKQRSDLLIEITQILENQEIKLAKS